MSHKVLDKSDVPNIATCAELESIALMKCTLEINNEHAAKKGKINIEIGLEQRINDENTLLTGELNLKLRGITDDNNGDEYFSIETIHTAQYNLKESHSWKQEDLDRFTTSAVLMHTWSYAREFASDLTSKANLPKVTLPLLPISVKETIKKED